MNKCSKCGIVKDLSCFNAQNRNKNKIRPDCKSCISKRQKQYRIENTNMIVERDKIRKRKSNYGLTDEDYQLLLLKQNFVCVICLKQDFSGPNGQQKDLSVDHCHSTGRVRGLLCRKCNLGLGHFSDERETLLRAAEYVNADII